MAKKRKTSKNRRRAKFNTKRYFTVLGITLAVILAGVLACMGLNIGTMIDDATEEVATVPISGGKINVLLMGVDNDGLRTDAIMLASYNTETKEVHMLSIPRDTRMYVGARYQKINAAHAVTGGTGKIAGAQGTVEAVSRLTAIPINYYVEFSFASIAACMDKLGSVTFEVPDIEGNGKGLVYDDPVQDLHINIPAGVQELNGEQVVHLLRYRKGNYNTKTKSRPQYKNGDIGRIEMQQRFLTALVDQKLNASLILKLPAIFKEVSNGIKTNLTAKDVLNYSRYLNDFTSAGIHTYSLPGEPSGGQYDASYWICDIEATKEIIQNNFGYDASGITVDKPGTTQEPTSGQKTETPLQKNTPSVNSTNKPANNSSQSSAKSNSSNSGNTSSGNSEAKATNAPSKTNAPVKDSSASTTKTPQKDTTQTPQKSDTDDNKSNSTQKTAIPEKKPSVSSNESSSTDD